MSIAKGKIYYVNSEYKISGTNSRFTYQIQIPQNSGFDHVCVLQASIPLSFYLVQNGTNTFTLTEDGIDTVMTIPEGNYNYQTFMTAVTSLLNTNSHHGWIYSITFSLLTAKYTFKVTGNSGQPTLSFTNHMSQQFGFNKISNNEFITNTLTSVNTVNFIPESTIYIHSDIVEDETDVLQEIYSNNTIPYSQVTYQLKTDVLAYSKKLRTTKANSFSFYLTNEEDDELLVNGQDVLITLLLYKKDDFTDTFKKYISWMVQKSDNE